MIQDKIKKIPEHPGVYIFKTKSGKILYIGKAKNLKKRLQQYFQKDIGLWKEEMLQKAYDIDFILTDTEEEAFLLENNLIKKYQPPFNSLLKGDTGYVYIKIGFNNSYPKSHPINLFPRISITRYKEPDGAIYIGPKPWKKELKKLLQILRTIFKFRTCSNTQLKKGKICGDYIFGLCRGRCIIKNNLKEAKKEYDKLIKLIIRFFKGDTKPISDLLLEEIKKAVEKQNFERAAKLRDTYFWLEKFVESQQVVFDEPISGKFILAKKVGDYLVLIIAQFFQGKLIDLIKYKEKIDDQSDWKANIKRDFTILEENDLFIFAAEDQIKDNPEILVKIKEFLENQIESIIISSSFEKENLLNDILFNIQKKLHLKNFPYKIEATDISHLSGGWTSGSLVKVIGGIPFKRGYRRYKIKSLTTYSDDIGALTELISRRFKINKKNINLDELDLPDLFIIDGGKNQLNIIKELAQNNQRFKKILEKVDFISIEKGEARHRKGKLAGKSETIYVLQSGNILAIPSSQLSDEEYKILTKARDEAHRFANKYREKQMAMERK